MLSVIFWAGAVPMTLTFPSTSAGPGPHSAPLKFYIYSAEIAIPLRVILIPVFHTWLSLSLRRSAVVRSPMRRCRSLRDSLNIVKHSKTSWNTCKTLWYIVKHLEPLVKHCEILLKHCKTLLKHCESSWNTRHSMQRYQHSMRRHRHLAWRYRRSHRVSGDCGVGITQQMCNRVTNHGDMGTFSKPALY